MLTPRRPNLFFISVLYLVFLTLLMEPVATLSEIGRFQMEIGENALARAQGFFQAGEAPLANLPTLSITALGLFFFIVPWIFRWVLELGYLYYMRGVAKEEPQSYRNLLEGFNYFRKAIIIRAIQAILYWCGLLLFILPGIWAFCAFSQANLLLLDHPDRSALWCLQESRRMMAGRKLDYFLLFLSFLGWRVLTLLPIPFLSFLALFWYFPYTTLTYVGYYNNLVAQKPGDSGWQRPGMF